MIKKPSQFLTLLLCFWATACSSAHKRAEKLLEGGAFEQASGAYDAILKANPGDADAIVGLQKSRQGLLDQSLIQVRLARMGGNHQQGLDTLLKAVKRENEWGYYPTGKVAFTQNEEATYAFDYVSEKSKAAISAKKPLAAEHWLKKYGPIFQGEEHQARHQALLSRATAAGKESCSEILKHASDAQPYFATLAKRYCLHFGETVGAFTASQKTIANHHFNGVSVKSRLSGVSPEQLSVLESDLNSALRETGWYDVESPNAAPTELAGSFVLKHEKNQLRLTHRYEVEVPYTAYEKVEKTKRIPYEDTEGGRTVTRYKEKRVLVTEPVTRYRRVPKYYPYWGVEHEQALSLSIKASSDFRDRTVPFELIERTVTKGIEHSENVPEIKLKPADPGLPDPGVWLKAHSEKLRSKFETKASQLYIDLYCKPDPSATTLATSGNQVERCLRQKMPEPPKFTIDWYEATFGLGPVEARDLLK